jgi:hypothetical protein
MFESINWIPSLVTTGLFSAVVFFSKNLIITRLTNSVKHEYDAKLEALKASNKAMEQTFQAEIQKRDSEITSIRNSALSGLDHRNSLLFERQLNAVDSLWQANTALSPAKAVSSMMSVFKIEEVSKTIEYDAELQNFFKTLAQNVDFKKLEIEPSSNLRPFVSKPIWAYFFACQSIVFHYVALAKIFELGLGTKMVKTDELVTLITKVLPHQKTYIEKHRIEGAFFLLEEIEGKLLKEIQDFLAGKGTSEARLKEASEIIKHSEQLTAKDDQTQI